MLNSLLANDEANTSVRQPIFEVSYGAGASGAGLAAAAGLLQGGEDSWARSVRTIRVEAGLAPSVDLATLEVAADEEAPQLALDDEGTISLGFEDSSAELVFSAFVNDIGQSIRGTQHIRVVNGGRRLSQLRINQSYEQQSAGEIVSDLARQAGAETDTVESGIDLPFYVVDDRYNAYEQIDRLARRSGYIAYFTIDGKLYFGPEQARQAAQTFSYASDILELGIRRNNRSVAVTVVGEGAAGAEGQDAWCWLIKDPGAVTAEAGSGSSRLIRDAALRSGDACQATADGLATRAGALALTGHILTPGAPTVVVGSTIEITGAPNDDMNGSFFVTRICHHYSKQGGFTSLIHFRQAGGSGGLLGGLL